MANMKIFSIISHDGKSKHFFSLPELIPMEELTKSLESIPGVDIKNELTDSVTEIWVDFNYQGSNYSVNNQHGDYYFFVDDLELSDEILQNTALVLSQALAGTEEKVAAKPLSQAISFTYFPWLSCFFSFFCLSMSILWGFTLLVNGLELQEHWIAYSLLALLLFAVGVNELKEFIREWKRVIISDKIYIYYYLRKKNVQIPLNALKEVLVVTGRGFFASVENYVKEYNLVVEVEQKDYFIKVGTYLFFGSSLHSRISKILNHFEILVRAKSLKPWRIKPERQLRKYFSSKNIFKRPK